MTTTTDPLTLTDLASAVDTLRRQVDRLQRRLRKVEQAGVDAPPLADILRSYPGGIEALAKACDYNPHHVYRYSRGKKLRRFPVKLAAAIEQAFADECDGRVLGVAVTVEQQRVLFERAREESDAAA